MTRWALHASPGARALPALLSVAASAAILSSRCPAQEDAPEPPPKPSLEIKVDLPPPEPPEVTLDLEGLHLNDPGSSEPGAGFDLFPESFGAAPGQEAPDPALEAPAPAPDQEAPDPALIRVAERIVESVLYFRGYDRFGAAVSSGAGAFVTRSGVAITDLSLIPPDMKGRIEYITATDGRGTCYRVAGALVRDAGTGGLLLQVELPEGEGSEPVEIAPAPPGPDPLPVAVVAFSPDRGLLVADARIEPEGEPMDGWFRATGDNSPATVGSPIFDMEGRMVAMAAMSLPVERWVTFALPVAHLPDALASVPPTPIPFDRLRMGAEADPLSDPRFVDAYRSISERRHATAARQLLRLTRDYPRSAEVWGLLGVASRGLGASAQSLAFFQRAAALRPESGALWLQVAMGGTTLRQGLPRDVLERAARGQPDNATAWLLLGGAQIDEADFSSADESLARAIGLAPSNATAYFLRAYAMGKLGDFEGAEVAAKQCVRLDRKNARAWFYLGLLHTRSGAIQEAIEAFRETVRIDPKHPHAWMNLSKAYLTVGNRTEARVAFDKHRSLPAGKPASERE